MTLDKINKRIDQIVEGKQYFSLGRLLYNKNRLIGTQLHSPEPITKDNIIATAKDSIPFDSITGFDLEQFLAFLDRQYPIIA